MLAKNFITDTKKDISNDSFYKNKKYKNIISEIQKTIKELKDQNTFNNGSFINYKNIQIIKPTIYFTTNQYRNLNKSLKKSSSGFYMSSIDGKLIVNGERKDAPIAENYCDNMFNKCINNYSYLNNNKTNGFCTYRRKNYSIDKINKQIINMDFIPHYRIRRINHFNRNFFKQELAKMNTLLFGKN